MDTSTWAVLLLLIGMSILIAEVFIPSGGLMAAAAIISLTASVACAWYAWWDKSPNYFWGFLASMGVALPASVIVAFLIWPHTAMGKRAILEAPRPEEVASFRELESHLARLPGRLGETLSVLNPAGMIRIDGQRIHCQSEGMIIETGVVVRVLAVHGNRVVVRRAPPGTSLADDPTRSAASLEPEASQRSENDVPLDFEIT